MPPLHSSWTWAARAGAAFAIGTAVAAPLPFGSQDVFWSTLWIAPLALACVLTGGQNLTPGETRLMWLVLAVPAISALVLAAQSGGVSPHGHPVWQSVPPDIGPLPPRGAVSARFPFIDLVPAIDPLLAFISGLGIGLFMRQRRRLLFAVHTIAAMFALLWLILHLNDPNAVLWQAKTHHLGTLTGTFYNRNMAAAFLAPGLVAAVLAVADYGARNGRRVLRARGAGRRSGWTRRWEPPAASAVIILLAMFATASRTGLALGLGGAVLAALLRLRGRHVGRVLRDGPVLTVLAAALLFTGLVVAEILTTRFEASWRVDAFRFEVYRVTTRIIADHWLLGVGPGRFADIFPSYRSAIIPPEGIWERAHQVYLQAAAEMGIFPLLAGMAAAVQAALLLGHAARADRGNLAAILGLTTLLMAALHGLVDYPLQIPGYSIPIGVLLGICVSAGARWQPSRRRARAGETENLVAIQSNYNHQT